VLPGGRPEPRPDDGLHFDERRLLTRLDYTAEVFGKWARGRHECRGHRSFDGLVFPTSRRVTLGPLPRPTIIWIEVDDVSVTRAYPETG
jgi:hypothetical protein